MQVVGGNAVAVFVAGCRRRVVSPGVAPDVRRLVLTEAAVQNFEPAVVIRLLEWCGLTVHEVPVRNDCRLLVIVDARKLSSKVES